MEAVKEGLPGVLAGVHVPLVEVLAEVAIWNPVAAADPDCPEIARLDQAIHGHVRNSQLTSDFGHGKEAPAHAGKPCRAVGSLAHVGGSI